MAFLDNSGDIILDAVLTDTGRKRLARADGSFRIEKFAFGDEEVNYGLYNKDHANGSAYFDLEILQTPVLEAFTNNSSLMKSKLISIPRTDLLYLPILKLNEVAPGLNKETERFMSGSTNTGFFLVAADRTTETELVTQYGTNNASIPNFFFGGSNKATTHRIRIDQGLDTTEISPSFRLDPQLFESQYIVEMDDRLGTLTTSDRRLANASYIDDDNIASYFIADAGFVTTNTKTGKVGENPDEQGNDGTDEVIDGPRGTFLQMAVRASIDLQSSTFLFTKMGTEVAAATANAALGAKHYFIDSTIRVTGANTGYSIDVPVRYIKKA